MGYGIITPTALSPLNTRMCFINLAPKSGFSLLPTNKMPWQIARANISVELTTHVLTNEKITLLLALITPHRSSTRNIDVLQAEMRIPNEDCIHRKYK